ncbi:MAG TPA: class I SAM-dependent methyltransferase [Lacipirellulaceae bacterium]|jgi:2-polyprenyl-3-methyl-5-hydroxy-6-metoxy-1,4-benzoquinol methylase|nr:class I SAM-dependent methyltransferase [Lacipirellulaceae bacterium]
MNVTLTAAAPDLDESKVAAFSQRLVDMLSSGALTMMISIGHRTGLFDVMADLPPATSEKIARQAGLNERYVREWLGAMVTGRIVNFNPARREYELPAEHAACLTRGAVPANFAATMQWIAVLGGVEGNIVECFQHGGGVHYEQFHRFHEVMAEESAQTVVAALTEHILPLAEGLADNLARGIDVLDIGCGSGRAVCQLAAEFPNSRFVGYDLCEEAVSAAREDANRRGLTNARFESRDVSQLGERDKFDLITAFDAIHDQAKPDVVLREIVVALRPDGTFLMQDILASSDVEKNIENPLAPLLYTISTMHCMTVSLAQGGAGLGTCWGRELAEKMLADAGLRDIAVEKLPHDDMNYYYIARK